MKLFILNLIILIMASANLFSQKVPVLAALNPDYLNFLNNLDSDKIQLPDTNSFGTGGMPPPGIVSFDDYMNKGNLRSVTFSPVYDMRLTGLLTPVRGQTNNGCWAFATMASVESRWLVLGLGASDLSENNLKYCHGFDASRSYYGNHWMSTAYFARRSGALIESDDPNVGGSPGPGQCPSGKVPVAYITDARYLPHDMNTIKQSILDQGAIYTMLYYNSGYYNAANFTYYYNGTTAVNHCVALVGWDDNKVTAGGTGAWICKNSYGLGWGEAGYFYVSYNDKKILDYNAYWPSRIDNVPSSKIYGYDDLGNYQSVGYGSPLGYTLVKFVGAGKQLLTKVGTYATGSDATMEIDIFDNFDPVTKALTGLILHQSGLSCVQPGYYTFDLSTPIAIQQGNDFYVRIRYQTPGFNNPLPIERLITGYAVPFIESNVSWLSDSGEDGSWFVIGNSTSNYKWDPCIKVYAETLLTWNGNASTDWNNASNWSPPKVPESGLNVVIPDVANKPVVNQDPATPAVCNDLTIDEGSSLTINSGKALTVNGTLTNNADNSGLVLESGSSLVTMGDVEGTAIVHRAINGGDWHLISPPVSNAVSNLFIGKYLQTYDEATDAYLDITSETERLSVMTGYAVFNTTPFVVTYSGMLNNGLIGDEGNLSHNNQGWNLVGNPYPSYIDWEAPGWTKSNVSDAVYLSVNSSTWASYAGGVGTNGGSRYIAPGQGFFVHISGNGSGTLAMNNSIRVHDNALFYKKPEEKLLRLKVSGNGYSDESVIRFLPEATTGFDDNYDAIKLFGDVSDAAQLYSVGTEPLSINSLPESNTVVRLGVRVKTNGVFTIAKSGDNSLGDVKLEDIKTGIFTDLNKTSYTFNFTSGENEERFLLHFESLAVNENGYEANNIYSFNGKVVVDLMTNKTGSVFIYNISGQLVSTSNVLQGINKFDIATTGNYVVKLLTEKSIQVKKIWIQ
jgi:C1A family cysteine protease